MGIKLKDDVKLNKSILFVFCLILFPITINRLGLINYIVLYGIPTAYLLLNLKLVYYFFGRLNIKQFNIVLQLLLLIALSIIFPIIHGTDDFTYINVVNAIFRKIILILFLSVLVIKRHRDSADIGLFLKYYSYATSIYVLGSFVFIALPSLREFWRNFLGTNQTLDLMYYSYGYKTRFGWSGFSGFRNTIDCTLSIIFLVTLYFGERKNNYLSTFQFYFRLSLCFIGNMLYGRIGIAVSAIVFILSLLLYKQIKIKTLLSFFLTGFVLLSGIIFLKDRIPIIYEWYDWSLQPMINFLTKGSFDNYSANHLIHDMVFMPSFETFFFGDGRYIEVGTGLYYMRTDSGFMRQLLFWGILGCIISYSSVINSLMLLGKKYFILSLLVLVAFVIFEYKGETYYEIVPIFLILGIWQNFIINQMGSKHNAKSTIKY